jgi:hypothetical protein
VSPRKSSTSSGRPRRPRYRYLGLEVAGEPLPPSPAAWATLLREELGRNGAGATAFRLIRCVGARAIVRTDRDGAESARRSWNRGSDTALRTVKTWGTLVGAKRWLDRATDGQSTEGASGPRSA